MAISPTDSNQIDHLSNLPDQLLLTILSLLPTDMAAQTSILSRRFRYLWEASPSLDLICQSRCLVHNFLVMVDGALFRRNPSHPLSSLRLDLSNYREWYVDETCSFISSLLSKAHSFGLSHLTIEGFSSVCFASVLPVIFSMDTLKSLSLDTFPPPSKFPSEITLTSLRSLSLQLFWEDDTAILNLILPKLCALKDLKLYLEDDDMPKLSLSSRTIRNLELIICTSFHNFDTVQLCLPSLESLHLKTEGQGYRQSLPQFHGEIPLLKKAVIALYELGATCVCAIHQMLNCISHVEELALHIKESTHEKCPIPILLEPRKDVPNFLNLKHLDVTVCFHGHNLEAVVTMLHRSPALESINLVHEVPMFTWDGRGRKIKDWGSKLPRNDDGNYHYAYFRNLHIGDNRKRFMKLISKKCASKRQAFN